MNGSQMYENAIHIAVFVYAMLAGGRPSFPSHQLRRPSELRISRQEYTRARYDAQSGSSTSTNRTARVCGFATRAMKYANGKAITASVRVTAAAIPIVRSATVR